MSNLITCETDKGNYAVRPDDWAGIWTEDGKLKEVGFCAPAIFRRKEDAEEYVRLKDFEEIGFTPEQIRQIDELYTEKCRELADERKKHEWIPADQPPKPEEYVLLSFENFSIPLVGMYRNDGNEGAYHIGDDEESCISQYMFVDAWMPLPKPYDTEGDEHE